MYEPSFMSTNSLASVARSIAHHGHPKIDIRLDEHNDETFTYTTGDTLTGQVSITAPHTTRFDDVHITLEGVTSSHVVNMTPVAAHAKIEARHPFLKLAMPIPDSDYPQPRVAEAGAAYKFPFNFVIPSHLLLHVCKHACDADHVREAHLRLPPSMGDRDVSPSDDLSPEMAKIQYAIKVVVTRTRERDGKMIVLAERGRKIRVIPAIPEAPPMHIPADSKDYIMSVTKSLKKGMFAGKLGRIAVSASQTKALVVSSTSAPPTIMATLRLRFDPSEIYVQPPKLGSLSSKIKTSTFHAVRAQRGLANPSNMLNTYDLSRGVYSTTTTLPSRCVEKVAWAYHAPSSLQNLRRDSGYSTCSSNSSTSEATVTPSTKGWYEANIPIPLTLPANKTWLPTFHSCLVSRIYCLEISLGVHTPGTGVPATTISLKLPVQISSGSEEASIMNETVGGEVEEYFRPRLMSIPDEEFITTSVLPGQLPGLRQLGAMEAPPEYEILAPRWGVTGSGRN